MEELSEEERRALRGSKFAPLPPPISSRPLPKLAHPGGPLATNKAAALAKFLERKLQDPTGLSSIDPNILQRAVVSAQRTVIAGTSSSGRSIRHVASFSDDDEEPFQETGIPKPTKQKQKVKKNIKKKKKKKNKNKNQKGAENVE